MTIPATPPDRAPAPLTDAQRALAAAYLPLARGLARPYKRRVPFAWAEIESAACLGLIQAAGRFDPGRKVRFATFARRRIRGAIADALRGLILRGWYGDIDRAPELLSLTFTPELRGEVLLCTPDEPVGEATDRAELIDSWLAKLPARHAAAIRLVDLGGRTQREAARAIGCSASRLSYLRREALEILRDIAGHSRSVGRT